MNREKAEGHTQNGGRDKKTSPTKWASGVPVRIQREWKMGSSQTMKRRVGFQGDA